MSTPAGKTHFAFHRYDFAIFTAFIAYAASSVAVPVVLVQLAAELNFPLTEGGMSAGGALQISRSLAIVTLLIFSGFIAGRYGKRKTIGWATFLMGTGILAAALAQNYTILFCAMLIAGFGEGQIEGMGTPFVQDLHRENTSQYMNITHGMWSVGVFACVILSGYALVSGISWRTILLVIAGFALIPMLLLLMPQQKGHEYPEGSGRLDVSVVLRQSAEIMKTRRFWVFFAAIFLGGGAEYCLTFWIASLIQVSAGGSALMGGIATAVFAAGMATGRIGGGFLIKHKYMYHFLFAACVGGILCGIPVPFLMMIPETSRVLMFVLMFLLLYGLGLSAAPLWPTIQTYAVSRLPENLDSTMIYVILSCAGVPGCGVFTFLAGVLSDACGSLALSFLLVPGCFAGCLLLLWAERQSRKIQSNF